MRGRNGRVGNARPHPVTITPGVLVVCVVVMIQVGCWWWWKPLQVVFVGFLARNRYKHMFAVLVWREGLFGLLRDPTWGGP